MKKLKLNLSELKVETFYINENKENKGTVNGQLPAEDTMSNCGNDNCIGSKFCGTKDTIELISKVGITYLPKHLTPLALTCEATVTLYSEIATCHNWGSCIGNCPSENCTNNCPNKDTFTCNIYIC